MKKVLASMSKFIFGGFAIAVLALLMSLTYGALQKLFPGSFANQMWGLVMFDISAMCWAIAFVFQSRSTGQYAAAGIGFIVGFVGTLLMVAYEVVTSGQNIANVNAAELGRWVVYGFVIVTALHAFLIYAHHALSPDIHEQINVGVARGEIVTEAISQATKSLEEQKAQLAHTIHADIVSQVKRDLGLYPVQGTPFEPKQLVLEPAPTQQKQTKPRSLWDAVKQGLRGKPNTHPYETVDGAPRTNGSAVTAFADMPPAHATEQDGEPISDFVRQHMWDPNDPNDSPFAKHHPWADKYPRKDDTQGGPTTYHYHPVPVAEDQFWTCVCGERNGAHTNRCVVCKTQRRDYGPKEDAPDAERPFRGSPSE